MIFAVYVAATILLVLAATGSRTRGVPKPAAGMEVAMPQACANANLDTMVWIVKYCARIGSIAVALDDVMSHSRD